MTLGFYLEVREGIDIFSKKNVKKIFSAVPPAKSRSQQHSNSTAENSEPAPSSLCAYDKQGGAVRA